MDEFGSEKDAASAAASVFVPFETKSCFMGKTNELDCVQSVNKVCSKGQYWTKH